ncbi:MAG TPA: sulfatase/phosphatase domain-containing protein [Gemmataceae bacterium]|jgi:arylsulfatase A-like enzyme
MWETTTAATSKSSIGVPLLFRGPGIPAGARFETACYLRDLFPTVCDLAGIAIPEMVEGKSLAPVLAGKTTTLYPHVFGHFRDVQRMVRTERWKLIFYPKINKYQLFDLSRDPPEQRNLADDPRQAKVLAALRRKLAEGPRR